MNWNYFYKKIIQFPNFLTQGSFKIETTFRSVKLLTLISPIWENMKLKILSVSLRNFTFKSIELWPSTSCFNIVSNGARRFSIELHYNCSTLFWSILQVFSFSHHWFPYLSIWTFLNCNLQQVIEFFPLYDYLKDRSVSALSVSSLEVPYKLHIFIPSSLKKKIITQIISGFNWQYVLTSSDMTYLWASFCAIHDCMASESRKRIPHFVETLCSCFIPRIYDPSIGLKNLN